MKELWLPVVGYEGLYEVSNQGNIRSVARRIPHSKKGYTRVFYGSVLTPITNKSRNNYCYISLKKDGKKKNLLLHRLIAQAFIPNPENKNQINHKDYNPCNNAVNNLEWCDSKYNLNYSLCNRKDQKGKHGRKVTAYDMSGNLIGSYNTVREAARQLNVYGQNICSILSGKNKWIKGYTFKDAA